MEQVQKHQAIYSKQPSSNKWRQMFFSTRSRILFWYVFLMTVSALISVLVIRQVLLTRLQERVERSLTQEIQEFQKLAVDGRDPQTGKPFGDDVAGIFKVFLRRNIPEDDEFLITLLNGEFYRASPRALPPGLAEESVSIKALTQLTQDQHREVITSLGEQILYRAEPIVRGEKRGVFVVAHLLDGERQEVDEATLIIVYVTIGVIVVASITAWFAAGRVLAPLRLLSEAAHEISESDLTRRIAVQGDNEISELTDRFNAMLDRLQSAFASQRDFISDAGHELRTPITIIRGNLEFLGDNPAEQQETITLVIDELDRMSRFVDDLLLLAKAEQPNFLTLDLVDVASLTEELYAKVKALAPRNWCLEMKGKGRIVADRQRLTQAVMNLAQNATQHTHPNDTIALGSVLEDCNVRFWVRDTGKGIALADQQRIFERFARAPDSYPRSEGAGLGLAIVRSIAQAHGGQIELVSRLGNGATFTLVIPIDPV